MWVIPLAKGGQVMKIRLFAALFLGMMLIGCGGSDGDSSSSVSADDLQGDWVLNVKSYDSFEGFQNLPETQQHMTRGIASDMSGLTVKITSEEMIFKRGSGGDGSKKTYTVTSTEGSAITLNITHRGGRSSSTPATLQGDHLLLDLDGQLMAFKREQ
jgi:hypothetical protein